MKQWEKKLQDGLLLGIGSLPWCRVWRNNVGRARPLNSPKTVVHYGRKGMSDVFGLLRGGRFICIEVKSDTGTESPEQKSWGAMVQSMGAIYIVARLAKGTTNETLQAEIDSEVRRVTRLLESKI